MTLTRRDTRAAARDRNGQRDSSGHEAALTTTATSLRAPSEVTAAQSVYNRAVLSGMHGVAPIVLVEDNDDDAFFVGAALKGAKISNALITVTSAAEARAALLSPPRDRLQPVLFILDVELPGGESGVDFLRWLRRQDEPLASTPAMMLTGTGRASHDASRALGSHFYLEKPVSPEQLANAVQALGFVVLTTADSGGAVRIIERR